MSERNSVWLRDKFQTLQTDVTRGCYRYQISDVANENVRCCGQLRYVNELSLVKSAINEVIGEIADTYRELSCWGKSDVIGISVEQTADANVGGSGSAPGQAAE
ncbi:glucan endo-1,3-beta-D-glucosidase [Dorcoceras hygrometricum]|uniref:Glucan endo-1,3-beta-D-glucosidase n=1 Tax=Dorcoceras hygrometricum TaxID=472368 RepID=A0A2Z6ZYI8_9LAMI|nr:glucan endo-1,3-beta-D-glucosidase [Dorcoceras hygrometricum]